MPDSPGSFLKKNPKQSRARTVVESIVTAATQVFKRGEFDQTTTNRIAELAGVSIGSLYQYFPNKDALIGFVIQRRVDTQLEALKEHFRKSAASAILPREALSGAIRLIAQDSLANRAFLKTIYEKGVALHLVPAAMEGRKRACSMVESYLHEYAREKLRPGLDLNRAVYCLLNAVLGVISTAVVAPAPEVSDEDLIRELEELSSHHLFG